MWPKEKLGEISCKKKEEERVQTSRKGLEKQENRFEYLLPQGQETQEGAEGQESYWYIEKAVGEY